MGCSVSNELSSHAQNCDSMTNSPLADRQMFDQLIGVRSPSASSLRIEGSCLGERQDGNSSRRDSFRDRRPKSVDTSYTKTYNTIARERRRLSRRDCPLFWLEDGPQDGPVQSASG